MKTTCAPTLVLLVLLSLFAVFAVGNAIPEPDAIVDGAASLVHSAATQQWRFALYEDPVACANNRNGVPFGGAGSLHCSGTIPGDRIFFNWRNLDPADCTAIFYETNVCTDEVGRSAPNERTCHDSHQHGDNWDASIQSYSIECSHS